MLLKARFTWQCCIIMISTGARTLSTWPLCPHLKVLYLKFFLIVVAFIASVSKWCDDLLMRCVYFSWVGNVYFVCLLINVLRLPMVLTISLSLSLQKSCCTLCCVVSFFWLTFHDRASNCANSICIRWDMSCPLERNAFHHHFLSASKHPLSKHVSTWKMLFFSVFLPVVQQAGLSFSVSLVYLSTVS